MSHRESIRLERRATESKLCCATDIWIHRCFSIRIIRIWTGLYTQNEMTTLPSQDRDTIFTYHQATKHHFNRFADGPGRLDWATQPDPFRRYAGAPLIKLAHVLPGEEPPYAAGFLIGHVSPAPMDFAGISRLFLDSLALSAWKQYGGERWAFRVNPSSGNLHPTEGYLLCGPVLGLTDTPMVAHYAPREHALEVRATFPVDVWKALTAGLPPDVILRRPDLDPLARGVEIRPARLSLLPARCRPRACRHQHRRGGPGLAGSLARRAEHRAGRRTAGRGGPIRAGG